MSDLVAAELLKLRTTRLLIWLVPAAIALSAAAVIGTVLAEDRAERLITDDGVERIFSVAGAGAIIVLIAGILISAGEYRHGTAADTYLTTPRRERVLVAKLAVGALLGLSIGAVTAIVSVGLAAALYPLDGVTFPIGDAAVWLTLAGALLYTTLFAVLGVAVGALLRNQVLAVAIALAWLAIIEHTLVNLVAPIGRWLPAAAGLAIVRTPLDGLLSPLVGGAVLCVYATVVSLAAFRVAQTRDV
jgi:ABC-2 type transport system permease protein